MARNVVEIDEEIGIKLKAGIGRGKNAEDAAYMADIGLEEKKDALKKTDINTLTPIEAMNELYKLKKLLG